MAAPFELAPGVARQHLERVNAEIYHADRNAVSKSVLDQVALSPMHARAYLDGIRIIRSDEMDLGQIAHAMILEADSVNSNFMHPGARLDRRFKRDKEIWAECEERAKTEHKKLLTYDQWTAAIAIRDAVYQHKTARAILAKGSPEETFVWRDPATGELCKCRIDWLRDSFLTDIKTARNASPQAFARAVTDYRYHVQSAHYVDGPGVADMGFIFVVVETEPPFAVAVYADYEAMRKLGRHVRDKNLATYAECKRTGVWPGYPDEIQTIELAPWQMKETA